MYIGVDLGGTNIGVGVVNTEGEIIAEVNAPTYNERSFDEIEKDILKLIIKIINDNNLSDVKGLGLGLPGMVDKKNGIFVSAPNIKVDNFKMKEFLEKKLKMPIFLENDANCAALAEAVFGATKDYDNSLTITIGTGVGAGMIINKKIYGGFNNCAGEVGHILTEIDGKLCGCGRNGCLQEYASSKALRLYGIEAAKGNPNSLMNDLSEFNLEQINGNIIFEAAQMGDDSANKVLKAYFRYLGEGIVNIINALGPDIIAIGGSISKQGDKLLEPIRDYVKKYSFCRSVSAPKIVAAKFDREAGIIGASMLGRQNL